jgi:protein SCO1/2
VQTETTSTATVSAVLERAPVLALLLLAAVLAGCGSSNDGAGQATFQGPTLEHPSTPPGFTLTDQHGRTIQLAALHGKVVLLTFLYTHCPDVCPLTASNLNTMLRRLGSQRNEVEVLAVSVDPVGDTPRSVSAFVRAHRLLPGFHYLTGPRSTLVPVWRAYDVKAVRNGKDGGVDHTLYTMLIDRGGTARVLFDATARTDEITHDVRQLLSA